MIGSLIVFSLLALICVKAVKDPAYGVIGFYGFVTLDPKWNWRWSLPSDFEFQKIIFAFIVVGLLIRGFQFQKVSSTSRHGLILMLCFYLWSLISASMSLEPPRSWWFMSYLWKILLVTAIGIVTIDTPRKVGLLLTACVMGTTYNSYQINLDYFETGFAKYAYTDWGYKGVDNNGYQLITLPMIAIALTACVLQKRLGLKFLWGAAASLSIHQVMLSYSRGALVALLSMLVCTMLYLPRNRNTIITMAAFFIASIFFAGPSVVQEVETIFASGETRDTSAQSRIHLWKIGVELTEAHPILGTGPEAYRGLIGDTKAAAGLNYDRKSLHNIFLDISVGMGLPGLAFFLGFVLLPWVKVHKYLKSTGHDTQIQSAAYSIVIGLPAYLIGSMFSSVLLAESSFVLVVASYCTLNMVTKRNKTAIVTRPYSHRSQQAQIRALGNQVPHHIRGNDTEVSPNTLLIP